MQRRRSFASGRPPALAAFRLADDSRYGSGSNHAAAFAAGAFITPGPAKSWAGFSAVPAKILDLRSSSELERSRRERGKPSHQALERPKGTGRRLPHPDHALPSARATQERGDLGRVDEGTGAQRRAAGRIPRQGADA